MIITDGHASLDTATGDSPVLFLDVDGVLQPASHVPVALGAFDDDPINPCRAVRYLVTGTKAVVVLCTDRVAQDLDSLLDALDSAGLERTLVRGACDPMVCPEDGESSKTQRVLDWLSLAAEHGVRPRRFVILDDARTFGWHPVLGPHHIAPTGDTVTDSDLARAWSILDPEGSHYRPRAYRSQLWNRHRISPVG